MDFSHVVLFMQSGENWRNCCICNKDLTLVVSPGGMCPGGMCPGGKCPGGKCPGGKCPGGICPGGFCPRTGLRVSYR